MSKSKEVDLRHWLTKQLFSEVPVFWIEPNRGSSTGLADAMIALDGVCSFIELKRGKWLKDGSLRWTVRPAQRRAARVLSRQGVRVSFLVCVPAEGSVWLLEATPETIYGRAHPEALQDGDLAQQVAAKWRLIHGVNLLELLHYGTNACEEADDKGSVVDAIGLKKH